MLRRPAFWVVMTCGLALGLAIAVAGCSDPDGQSTRDQWIIEHPIRTDDQGRCWEFDGEPCDEDPFDLDDLWEPGEVKAPKAKISVKPVAPKPVKVIPPPPRPATRR